MPVVAVIGAQWGDEGKGKIVDLLAGKANMVVRFNGGPNAGHTVVNPWGTFRLHLVPSGIFYPDTLCLIDSGVVISPTVLLEEMDLLKKSGLSSSNLVISERAHLIMPYHLLQDKLQEESLGDRAIGTTRTGIGPVYADKAARLGIRAGDLLDREDFRHRLRTVLEQKNAVLDKVYGASSLLLEDIYSQYCQYAERLGPHIRETGPLVEQALERKAVILLEGAQGTLLDVDFGTYPYVTASSSMVGGACTGMGLSPTRIDRILGVFKAYTSRVGNGPMPTELEDETGELIRQRAHEYGTLTGRPRRCGWFDAVAARFSAQINGFTGFVLTHLDTLDVMSSIKICTGYRVGDNYLERFPSRSVVLARCEPVYEELPGWQSPTDHLRRFEDLPSAARAYISRLGELIGCPIDFLSLGPGREDSIAINPVS